MERVPCAMGLSRSTQPCLINYQHPLRRARSWLIFFQRGLAARLPELGHQAEQVTLGGRANGTEPGQQLAFVRTVRREVGRCEAQHLVDSVDVIARLLGTVEDLGRCALGEPCLLLEPPRSALSRRERGLDPLDPLGGDLAPRPGGVGPTPRPCHSEASLTAPWLTMYQPQLLAAARTVDHKVASSRPGVERSPNSQVMIRIRLAAPGSAIVPSSVAAPCRPPARAGHLPVDKCDPIGAPDAIRMPAH